jgi:hypothetical protein
MEKIEDFTEIRLALARPRNNTCFVHLQSIYLQFKETWCQPHCHGATYLSHRRFAWHPIICSSWSNDRPCFSGQNTQNLSSCCNQIHSIGIASHTSRSYFSPRN